MGFLDSDFDTVLECLASTGPFLMLIKLHCSLHGCSQKLPHYHLWLGCLSSAALILSVFCCTWLQLCRCSKITELGTSCLPAAPARQTVSEEQLIMGAMLFQSRCDGAHRLNPPHHRRNSQSIPFASLITRMSTTGSLFCSHHFSLTSIITLILFSWIKADEITI